MNYNNLQNCKIFNMHIQTLQSNKANFTTNSTKMRKWVFGKYAFGIFDFKGTEISHFHFYISRNIR